MSLNTGEVLVILLQETGAFHATFALARTIEALGNQVCFLTVPAYQNYVVAHGFETWRVTTFEEIHPGGTARTRDDYYFDLCKQRARTSPPMLVLVDQITWWLAAPFAAEGIAIGALSTTYAYRFSLAATPVFSPRVPRFDSWRDGPGNLVDWAGLYLRNQKTNNNRSFFELQLASALGRNTWRYRRRRVRQSGLSLRWGEYGYRLDLAELVLAPRALDFPALARKATRFYAGPCVDSQRQDGLNPKDPAQTFPWERIDAHRPLVYASLGSYSLDCPFRKSFYTEIINTARALPQFQWVLHQVDDSDSEAGVNLPENLVVAAWCPQLALLQKASLFLTHGGLSSVKEATYHGVPMVFYPFFNDGPGNMSRAVFHGTARQGRLGAILEDVGQMMNDPQIDHAATRLKQSVRAEEKPSEIISFLTECLSR